MYAVAAAALWSVPLLSILHVESSAVLAAVAYFAAGCSTLALLERGRAVGSILLRQEAALLLPAFLLTVSAAWQPNCDYARGLLFFIGFPGATVIFAVAAARLVHALRFRRKYLVLCAFGVLTAVVPTLFDLGLHPQFYSYNHVYGGFLGPIYDEQLAVRPGLVTFRLLTLVWSAFFLLAARWIEEAKPSARIRGGTAAAAALIALSYYFASELGFVTSYERIERTLGAVHRTEHFEIYFDPRHVTAQDLRLLEDEHEYRYDVLRAALGVDVDEPIRSYVYPNADVKAALTGARYTNVAPVWLSVPQTHVLQPNFRDVFPHELVHVFSREFGLPLLNASLSVGLVEGLAVALEPPSGAPSPHEQVSAALLAGALPGHAGESVESLVDVVAARLSPLGFWTGRGAVSYTTMGSFVRFLLDEYGASAFVRAYATGSFEDEYRRTPEQLAAEWTERLMEMEAVSSSSAGVAAARFAVPSLFEKDCPHHLPRYRRRTIEARRELAAGDTAAALEASGEALVLRSSYVPAAEIWSGLALVQGRANEVVELLASRSEESMSAGLYARLGDAYAWMGRADEARRTYDRAIGVLPPTAHEATSLLLLRSAVAHREGVLRVLVTAEAGRQLDLGDERPAFDLSGAERAAAALALHRAGQHEQAADLLRTTSASALVSSVPYLGGALERRRLVWLREMSYAAERVDEAADYAARAARVYREVGALNEASLMDDIHAKMTWAAARSTSAVSGRSDPKSNHPEVR